MKAILILLWVPLSVFGWSNTSDLEWGATGHRVVGELAAQRISKRTAKKIDALLEGVSLAETSTFADEIKSDKRYRAYSPWHYANIKGDETYALSKKMKKVILFERLNNALKCSKTQLLIGRTNNFI